METKAVIGPVSQMQMRTTVSAKLFGINGIDKQYGFTTPDTEEASIKRIAIEKMPHKVTSRSGCFEVQTSQFCEGL